MTKHDRNVPAQIAFGTHDRVVIDGIVFQPDTCTDAGWLMTTVGSGLCRQFSHEELHRLNAKGRIVCNRGFYNRDVQLTDEMDVPFSIADLPWNKQRRLAKCSAYVEAFLALEEESRQKEVEGKGAKIKRTDACLAEQMDAIAGRAAKVKGVFSSASGEGMLPSEDVSVRPSPRTLRKWLAAYGRQGLAGLVDRMDQRGSRQRTLDPEVVDIMKREVDKYLSLDRPTQDMVFCDVRRAINAANKIREADGRTLLDVPSRETVRREIAKLDPYVVCLRRYGKDVARKRFRPVTCGVVALRPLERVEIDEWTVDTMTIMESTGLRAFLTDEELKTFGLDGSKARWKITVAICCATRCIVGMSLSRDAKASAALKALQMVVSDKKAWADAVGALSGWFMFGLPETVVTDCGPAFTSFAFQAGCAEMGVQHMTTAAGFPELRGTIERLFGTMSRDLSARLSGRTFSSIIEKGDADPRKRAALTVDDFCFALVRWIVDIYHNRPHRGLDSLTPIEKWREAVHAYGQPPALDIDRRRAVFGKHQTRALEKTGITVMGIRYHSDELAESMRRGGRRNVEIRWHPDDIGTITVKLGDVWTKVPALDVDLDGVGAQSWLAGVRKSKVRKGAGKDVYLDVAAEAARAIEERDAEARLSAGIMTQDWPDERVAREEEQLMVGTSFRKRRATPNPDGRPGQSVIDRTANPAARPSQKPTPGGFRTEED